MKIKRKQFLVQRQMTNRKGKNKKKRKNKKRKKMNFNP